MGSALGFSEGHHEGSTALQHHKRKPIYDTVESLIKTSNHTVDELFK